MKKWQESRQEVMCVRVCVCYVELNLFLFHGADFLSNTETQVPSVSPRYFTGEESTDTLTHTNTHAHTHTHQTKCPIPGVYVSWWVGLHEAVTIPPYESLSLSQKHTCKDITYWLFIASWCSPCLGQVCVSLSVCLRARVCVCVYVGLCLHVCA